MTTKKKEEVMERFKKIAMKVYRDKNNSIDMLINDLEDFFEMNNNDINNMTSDEFDKYIEKIYNNYEG